MDVCQWMLLQVPASETKIHPTNKCDLVVNDDKLLVVRLSRDVLDMTKYNKEWYTNPFPR